ncbi:ROK family protein [Clostridium sp. LIBA-8841]|uniref:ROK family protein n=1 Tax=Clostridium sp. LIBA-8841 TaxID=2987530 RepID=UPI002AC6B2FE|nr:ROK family protein [Clostridium sp. LIBA-8841]MDZ5253376.1 ROK family protein [Clostridium sp. LIBA-8841]
MKNYFIALDVGGSSIKSALVDNLGNVITNISVRDSLANKDKNTILKNFIEIIEFHISEGENLGVNIEKVGIAFPGPFDYEKGISLIRGIGKYESLYNINLKDELETLLPELEFKFKNDAHLYALGECNFREGKIFNKLLCICIGTGIGSAFIENKSLLYEGENIPKEGWIYDKPFKGSIADDYISTRGLLRIAEDNNIAISTGKELYELACNNDKKALNVFKSFGKNLKEFMELYVKKCNIEAIVIGGNISKAYEFFKEDLERMCSDNNVTILISEDSTESTLIAVPMLFKK